MRAFWKLSKTRQVKDMLLAIDTSTRYGGVALWDGDRAVSTITWRSTQNHTAELMPTIEYLLGRANASPRELEGIAVALGPGGFSALRVGISVAKGLALPLDIPLVGVGTLEMEAYPYADAGLPVCPILEAGRSEVAAALFQQDAGGWHKLREERIRQPEELVHEVPESVVLCGEGVARHYDYLRDNLGPKAIIVSFHTPASRLEALGILAGQRLKAGETDSLAAIQPIYIRRPSIGAPKAAERVSQ
jgi:tRNA threonylcarbamoyladenosine biosynthesis protein TsaB